MDHFAFRQFTAGILLGISFAYGAAAVWRLHREKKASKHLEFSSRPIELRRDEVVNGVVGLIGKTLVNI